MVPRITNILLAAFFTATGLSSLPGCYYDIEENLIIRDTSQITCDTTAVSYLQDIEPILQLNCLSCHSEAAPSGGVNLEGYNQVSIYAEIGNLTGSINHEAGYSPMPKDAPQLDSCSLLKINAWVRQGSTDN